MARSPTAVLKVVPGQLTLKAQNLKISLTKTTVRPGETVGVQYYFVYDSGAAGVPGLPDTITVPLKLYVNDQLVQQVDATLSLSGIGYVTPAGQEIDLSFDKPGTYEICYYIPDTITVSPSGATGYGAVRSSSVTLTVGGETTRKAKGLEVPWEYYLALGLAGASVIGIVGYLVYQELKKPGGKWIF